MISRYSRLWLWLLSALLYAGPVLAGLARHGWTVLPVFVALCLLHSTVTRKPDLATPAGWAGLGLFTAEQSVLVTALWALGLLLAGFGASIMLPLWAPMLVSALAAGTSAWAFRDAAEMDVMLESVLDALSRIRADDLPLATKEAWPKPHPATLTALNHRLDTLRGLEDWDQGAVDLIVQELADEVGAKAFDPFYDIAAGEEKANEPIVDYALLRYTADEGVRHRLIERGEAALAPMLLLVAPDAQVRQEARDRLHDLAIQRPTPQQMPDPVWLARLADTYPGEGYELLANEVDKLR